jgi:hypothetical protein
VLGLGDFAHRGRRQFAFAPEEEDVLDLAEDAGDEEVELAEEEGLVGGRFHLDADLPQLPGEIVVRSGVLRGCGHGDGPFLLDE